MKWTFKIYEEFTKLFCKVSATALTLNQILLNKYKYYKKFHQERWYLLRRRQGDSVVREVYFVCCTMSYICEKMKTKMVQWCSICAIQHLKIEPHTQNWCMTYICAKKCFFYSFFAAFSSFKNLFAKKKHGWLTHTCIHTWYTCSNTTTQFQSFSYISYASENDRKIKKFLKILKLLFSMLKIGGVIQQQIWICFHSFSIIMVTTLSIRSSRHHPPFEYRWNRGVGNLSF